MASQGIPIALVAGAVAVALWAYHRERRGVYIVAKVVASGAFVALAAPLAVPGLPWERLVLLALVVSAVADVSLALPGRTAFAVGLAGFTAAHATYAAAFVTRGLAPALAAAIAVALLTAAGLAWAKWHAALPPELRAPVAAYGVIVCLMVATGVASALATRSWTLGLGALLVPGSDIAVARERFGRRSFGNKLLGLPAYYVGQVLIALSLLG